ncbi:MAG: carboxypeptidase-like regulatory domain-containing protein [Flavobacteriales bacterium]|nr:carboxypeptidase-like regulatory domain-containing protein [Flavobacteriales bacterium]
MRYTMILLSAMLGAGAFGQNLGEIRGRVLDPDGKPLFMANVYTTVAGEMVGTTTDADGKFLLKPLPTGKNGLKISFTGFKTKELSGVEVVPDRATYVGDQQMAYIDAFGEVEIIAYKRKLIDRDDPSRMSLLASEFEDDPTRKDPIQFLSKNFAGVTAAPNGDGLYFRGSRTENTVSFIDGVKVSGGVPRVPPSAISSISVYTGGLPARYGDVTGGVIVIETKAYGEMFEAERRKAIMQETDDTLR